MTKPSVIYRDPAAAALPLYQGALAPTLAGGGGRLYEFPLTPFDRLGLPLWTAALIGADGALSDGFGYGATLDAARTSAWGETVEWHFAREALKTAPRVTAPYEEMAGRGALDPATLCLSADSPYQPSAWVAEWVQVTRHPTGEAAWVPIEFVAPRRADIGPGVAPERLLAVPITNGLGAGPTLNHAVAHGLLELLQRDGNSVHYRALDRGVAVDLDDVQDADTRALLAFLDAQGVEVIVKLAAADFGMANLYVVGYDRDPKRAPQPVSLSACGEAAHPEREFALAKALREFTMARARKAFNHGPLGPVRAVAPPGYLEAFRPATMRSEDDRALREMRGWVGLSAEAFFEMIRHPVFDVRETVRFSELPTTPADDDDTLLSLLTARLAAEGLRVYYADFTPAGAAVHVVRVIVPGLEVETLTYGRLGPRNMRRLRQRDSPLLGASGLDLAAVSAAMGPLYPLYREPGRHVIGFLEEAGG